MGKRVNLFSEKRKVKKVDDKAFDMMTAVSDKTDVSIIPPEKKEVSTKNIHHALMAAGMSPAYGNIADVADATLYALEGEFGEAARSMAAAIPVIGQMVTGKRALKAAKEAGEEMVTLYRGVDKWYPGNMVKEGKFMSPGQGRKGIYVTNNKEWVKEAGYLDPHWPSMPRVSKGSGNPSILEFEVPKSWFDKAKKTEKYGTVHLPKGTGTKERINAQVGEFYIVGGIPVKFLKKRHK